MTGAVVGSAPRGLPLRHALLALAVVTVWGSNFVVIHVALESFTPLWLAVMRFTLALLPALLALIGLRGLGMAKPAVPWRDLLTYGALIGAGQFGLLYVAMQGHISPGMASLVVQTQVFFTIALAMVTSGERIQPFQLVALVLAAAGLVLIGVMADDSATPLGLAMVLLAAASWAAGNIVGRRSQGVSALAYVVWSSFGALPPLLALALMGEGWAALVGGAQHASAGAWAAVAWQALGNALFGYAAWGWLMQRHAAATVTPWALLVPVVGMASSAWWLDESMPWWKLLAAALVMGGLSINLAWPWWRARRDAGAAASASESRR